MGYKLTVWTRPSAPYPPYCCAGIVNRESTIFIPHGPYAYLRICRTRCIRTYAAHGATTAPTTRPYFLSNKTFAPIPRPMEPPWMHAVCTVRIPQQRIDFITASAGSVRKTSCTSTREVRRTWACLHPLILNVF